MVDFVVNLVVFILSLALLIVIHEFGHYITAKMFNVYVTEFSIGFGPALYKKKKEGAETQFSIRAVPLGGFCSIVGEALPEFTEEEYKSLSDTDKELVDLYKTLPENRRLDGIPRYKRAVVMVAGVTLNFILGFILLVVYNAVTPVPTICDNYAAITENSIAHKAGWTKEDRIETSSYVITINGETQTNSLECVENTHNLYLSIKTLYNEDNQPQTTDDIATYTLVTTKDKVINFSVGVITNEEGKYKWEEIGITGFYYNFEKDAYYLSFGKVISKSFSDFGECSVAIFEALGGLFTPEGIQNVGGMIAIFGAQSDAMNMGFGFVVQLWALISINLGIMNLLPFPGLDGWHLLVIAIEGVTRKELPKKFKNIMSTIGMILLFGLMILITFKDIFSLFS